MAILSYRIFGSNASNNAFISGIRSNVRSNFRFRCFLASFSSRSIVLSVGKNLQQVQNHPIASKWRLGFGYNSYISDFVVNLYVNSWEKGFANSIIEKLSKVLHNNTSSRNRCGNVIDALNLCLYHHLEEEPHRHAFFDLWMKTINDFNPEARKIILYHNKAENENILSLCQPPKDWEELWIKNTNEFSQLVLYGICTKCREGYPFIIDYVKYQKERVANDYIRTNCKRCDTEGSFYVSPYILKYPPPSVT